MKRNAILLSLLTTLFLLPGKAVGQNTSSDGKLVYNFPFAPSEGLVNRTENLSEWLLGFPTCGFAG